MDNMLQHLLSKDVLYEPMSEISQKYPPWIEARRLFRTSTRLTLFLFLVHASVYPESQSCFDYSRVLMHNDTSALKVSHAPILVQCSFSMTLLRGAPGRAERGGGDAIRDAAHESPRDPRGVRPAGH